MSRTENFQLQAQQLTCIRDDRVLFSELSFELNAGQVVLLEGKNGSGKTSLLVEINKFVTCIVQNSYNNYEAAVSSGSSRKNKLKTIFEWHR